jgi:hypothetical protein
MCDKKFSVSEAWSVMLIFFDSIYARYREQITGPSGGMGLFLTTLQMDPECFFEWLKACKMNFDEKSLHEKRFFSDQLFDFVTNYVSYYSRELALPFSSLLDFLNKIRINQNRSDARILWNHALYRVVQGELWRREDQSRELESFLGTFGEATRLFHNDAASVTYYFLNDLSSELCRLVPSLDDRMASFVRILHGDDSATPHDWKRCCITTTSRPFNNQKSLTLEEVYSITVSFVAYHCYKFGFNVFELMALVCCMRSRPALYKKEWEFWRNALDTVSREGAVEQIL